MEIQLRRLTPGAESAVQEFKELLLGEGDTSLGPGRSASRAQGVTMGGYIVGKEARMLEVIRAVDEMGMGVDTTELAAAQAGLPQVFRGSAPIVVEGNPSEKILQQAKQDGVDLIVLGRTPTDALSRWLLGSTSEAVLTHAPQSVLIVPVEKRS